MKTNLTNFSLTALGKVQQRTTMASFGKAGGGTLVQEVIAGLLLLTSFILVAPPAQAEIFTAISADGNFTCVLTSSGGVNCWGYNGNGALGDGTTTTRYTAVPVTILNSPATAIDVGGYHACVITNGIVQCWGRNNYGQLGNGTTTNSTTAVTVSGLSGVTAISKGAHTGHTCVLTDSGIYCWGRNDYGQLGDGTTTDRSTPVMVNGVNSSEVKAIATGSTNTCILTNSDGVKCWGYNNYGQLGDGTTTDSLTPVDVKNSDGSLLTGITAIDTAGDYTCALTSSGGVKCWGNNNAGQLGDGTTTNRLTPVNVSGLNSGVTAIAVADQSCALLSGIGGSVKCWGLNDWGQVGDGTTINRLKPVNINIAGVTAIAAGGGKTCAITDNGSKANCWGINNWQDLGDGTNINRSYPGDVIFTPDVMAVILTVTKVGEGIVTAQGINCGADCTESYALNTNVQLTATADAGYTFSQWMGNCSGTGTTTSVRMDASKTCSASFIVASSNLTVGGTVWIDMNANGIKDVGDATNYNEAVGSGIGIKFKNLSNNQEFSTGVEGLNDDDFGYYYNGEWWFYNSLPAGDYKVEMQLPTGWVQLVPALDSIVHIDESNAKIDIGVQPPLTIGFGTYGNIAIGDVTPDNYCKRPTYYFYLSGSGTETILSYSITGRTMDGVFNFTTQGFQGTAKILADGTPLVMINPIDPSYAHFNPTNEVRNVSLNGNTISFDIPIVFNESASSEFDANVGFDFGVSDENGYSTGVSSCGHVPDTSGRIDAGPDITVKMGETVQFQGTVVDPDTNDSYEIWWEFEDTGEWVTKTLTPTHVFTTPGTYIVSFYAENRFNDDLLGDSLTVTVLGVATLTLTATNGTVTCNTTTCQSSYPVGDTVNLVATPASGFTFKGWTGNCAGTSATTSVTMDAAKNCTATFEPVVAKPMKLILTPTSIRTDSQMGTTPLNIAITGCSESVYWKADTQTGGYITNLLVTPAEGNGDATVTLSYRKPSVMSPRQGNAKITVTAYCGNTTVVKKVNIR